MPHNSGPDFEDHILRDKAIPEAPSESITEDWITCPYCGYQEVDSSEYPETAEIECAECEREFTAYRNVSICYTMVKKPKAKEGESSA